MSTPTTPPRTPPPYDAVRAKQRALEWATRSDGTLITRDEAINESMMALDVLDAIARIETLEDALAITTSSREFNREMMLKMKLQRDAALKFIDDINCDGCSYEDNCPSNARHYVCQPCKASREAARIRTTLTPKPQTGGV